MDATFYPLNDVYAKTKILLARVNETVAWINMFPFQGLWPEFESKNPHKNLRKEPTPQSFPLNPPHMLLHIPPHLHNNNNNTLKLKLHMVNEYRIY